MNLIQNGYGVTYVVTSGTGVLGATGQPAFLGGMYSSQASAQCVALYSGSAAVTMAMVTLPARTFVAFPMAAPGGLTYQTLGNPGDGDLRLVFFWVPGQRTEVAINGKGRPTKAQAAQAAKVKLWLDHISTYEREFKKWESRVDKIIKKYRDEDRSQQTEGSAKFNILFANVQTLVPVTYSKVPQPDVSRRFKDNDPVGRVAALMLERSLDFEVQHYEDFRNTMKASVLDRFLGGRGTSWARYEPHIRTLPGEPTDGVQVTEDTDEPNEELDYECAPVDYVHWQDFGHTIARTWDEVTGVWRKVYMTKAAITARFGEDWAKKIPLDAKPEDITRKQMSGEGLDQYRACIYEIWDKETGKAYWLSKSIKEMVDELDDPLGLEDFFPCPKPLFASLTNETLVPIPDFVVYQDQARQLDTLADRLDGLIQALQVKGVYDASIPEVGRIFTEGLNGTLIPVKNWAAFAEKNGLDGAIDVVDLKNIYEALSACYEAIQQCLKIIYDITGLADIVRGQSEASETATAQQIKGQYASLRLNSMKQDVALYATQLFQLKAQIICGKFAPETILQIAGIEQLSEVDKKLVPQALELLIGERATNPEAEQSDKNPLRTFRIEVNADTMVQIDEQQEKQDRMEFLSANGEFMDKATKMMMQAGPAAVALAPVIMELWKYGVTGFRVGRTVEGVIDQAADQIKQIVANPPAQKPDPEMAKVQAQQQKDAAQLQHDQQVAALQHQREEQAAAMQAQAQEREAALKAQLEASRAEGERYRCEVEARADEAKNIRELEFKRWEAELRHQTEIEVAEISAHAQLEAALIKGAAAPEGGEAKEGGEGGEAKPAKKPRVSVVDRLAEMHAATNEGIASILKQHGEGMEQMTKAITAPRRAVRGPDGRISGTEAVQ